MNGQSLDGSSYDSAMQTIREAVSTGQVTVVLCRDEHPDEREEFNHTYADDSAQSSLSGMSTPLDSMVCTVYAQRTSNTYDNL